MDLLDTAQEFYKKTPLPQIQDKRRKFYTKELLFVIETAPFLSPEEKAQMSGLIALYPTNVIKKVKNSLIEQGIVFLRLNPDDSGNIKEWLHKIQVTPAAG
jgi:hypothetical protein